MTNHFVTAVIGSYPVQVDTTDLMKNYFDQKESSWAKYIESAVGDMTTAGIEMIADGQTRDPFINIFTRKTQRDSPGPVCDRQVWLVVIPQGQLF